MPPLENDEEDENDGKSSTELVQEYLMAIIQKKELHDMVFVRHFFLNGLLVS